MCGARETALKKNGLQLLPKEVQPAVSFRFPPEIWMFNGSEDMIMFVRHHIKHGFVFVCYCNSDEDQITSDGFPRGSHTSFCHCFQYQVHEKHQWSVLQCLPLSNCSLYLRCLQLWPVIVRLNKSSPVSRRPLEINLSEKHHFWKKNRNISPAWHNVDNEIHSFSFNTADDFIENRWVLTQ